MARRRSRAALRCCDIPRSTRAARDSHRDWYCIAPVTPGVKAARPTTSSFQFSSSSWLVYLTYLSLEVYPWSHRSSYLLAPSDLRVFSWQQGCDHHLSTFCLRFWKLEAARDEVQLRSVVMSNSSWCDVSSIYLLLQRASTL